MNRIDEINELVKSMHQEEIQIGETDSDFGYLLDGPSPTIVSNSQTKGVFSLNSPRSLIKVPKSTTYVDRAEVSLYDTNKDIERVLRFMKIQANQYKLENGTHHNDYGFQMPGQEGKFCRENRSEPTIVEIRYYIDSFSKV